ncbi:type II toxin-antitoxin system HigB family toxin [Riemerella columbipharyngis]|uniref:mRNA interferase HigB n=1 Tax=Riemerella columbipharyngis TaxID=1071918 RepID=A0A1G7AJW4_9FLAO|nr:type II toxin-antitoxin system HigB family toxin [Riemerella columbipharyngis]SDE15198.1 mRNA interferase HigB [Riemerella columbipharyngis]
MVIISKAPINEYLQKYPAHREELLRWYGVVKTADWSNFADIRKTFNSVDGVGDGLYVFNVKGNHCRVVARIIFSVRTVFIKFVGTHKEYDKLNMREL